VRKRSREVAMEHEDDDEEEPVQEEAPVVEEKPKKEKRQKLQASVEKSTPVPVVPVTPVVTEGPRKRGRKSSVQIALAVVEASPPEPKPRRSCTIKETKETTPKSKNLYSLTMRLLQFNLYLR